MPELRHLRAFVAVAEELSFTRGAQRLHMAQQAVSRTIAQLESELGVELIVRSPREVRLTAAGTELLADAHEVLATADSAFARARAHGAGLAGVVSVGVTPAVGAAVAGALAREVRAAAPGLSVRLVTIRPAEIAPLVTERRIDVALTRGGPREEGLVVHTVASTAAELVVPSDHPLADAPHASLDRLDGERLLVWSPPGTPYTDLLLGLCAEAGASVTPVESRVTGVAGLVDLEELGAVAINPAGSAVTPPARAIPLEGVRLPLLAVRAPGRPGPAISLTLQTLGAGDRLD